MLLSIYSFFLIIVLFFLYKKASYNYRESVGLMLVLCTFCFKGDYIFYEPFKFITICIILFLFLHYKYVGHSLVYEELSFFYIYLATLIVIAIANVIIGKNLFDQLYNCLKWILLNFSIPFIVYGALKSQRYLKIVDNFVIFATIFICVYGFIEYIYHVNVYKSIKLLVYPVEVDVTEKMYQNVRGMISGRVGATLVHPLNYGQLLVALLGYYVAIENKVHSIRFFTLFVLISVGIILSGSRSCIVPMGLIWGYWILWNSWNNKYFLLSFFIIIILLTYVTISPELIQTINGFFYFWGENTVNMGGSSVEFRLYQWDVVHSILNKSSLFIGNGFGYMSTDQYKKFLDEMVGAESILFTIVLEQGLIGLVSFTLFLLFFSIKIEKNYRKIYNKPNIGIYVMFMSYYVSLLMTGNRDSLPAFLSLNMILLRRYTSCTTRPLLEIVRCLLKLKHSKVEIVSY